MAAFSTERPIGPDLATIPGTWRWVPGTGRPFPPFCSRVASAYRRAWEVPPSTFRSITDSDGNATLCLPAGEYRLLVSAADHEPYIIEGTVKDDMEIMAVLVPETDMTEIELEREYM